MDKLSAVSLESPLKKNFLEVILMRFEKLANWEPWDALIEIDKFEIQFYSSNKGDYFEIYKGPNLVFSTKPKNCLCGVTFL